MAQVTVTFPQLAQGCIALIQSATIKADDQSQALLAGIKQMLAGIASGQLTVSAAAPAATAAPTTAAAPVHATTKPVKRAVARGGGAAPIHPKQVASAGHVVTGPAPQKSLTGTAARGAEGVVPAGSGPGR